MDLDVVDIHICGNIDVCVCVCVCVCVLCPPLCPLYSSSGMPSSQGLGVWQFGIMILIDPPNLGLNQASVLLLDSYKQVF